MRLIGGKEDVLKLSNGRGLSARGVKKENWTEQGEKREMCLLRKNK